MNINDHIRTVVFDVDGTLVDTLPSLVAAANEVLSGSGMVEVQPNQLRAALSDGLVALFRRAISVQTESVSLALSQQLETEFETRYATRWLNTAVVFDGVVSMLSTLQARGIKLGICTNRDRTSTKALLDGASLSSFFDTVVCLGDTTHRKPAAAPLLLALQHLGGTLETSLYVGDSGVDAMCASAAGVRLAVHLGGYAATPEDLQPCAMTFVRHDALVQWICARAPASMEFTHHG